jgi:hypothetical protein
MLSESLPVQLHFLPEQVRIEDVARRTRHAILAFLSGSANGWGRTKLRSWLIVEYGMATEWTREDDVGPWLHPVAQMDDVRVQAAVEAARRRMTRLVAEASTAWAAPTFAGEMLDRGLITSVTDASGREAYAPASRVELSFLDRVTSLFIADFLVQPRDYAVVISSAATVRPPADSGICLRKAAETPETSGPDSSDLVSEFHGFGARAAR